MSRGANIHRPPSSMNGLGWHTSIGFSGSAHRSGVRPAARTRWPSPDPGQADRGVSPAREAASRKSSAEKWSSNRNRRSDPSLSTPNSGAFRARFGPHGVNHRLGAVARGGPRLVRSPRPPDRMMAPPYENHALEFSRFRGYAMLLALLS